MLASSSAFATPIARRYGRRRHRSLAAPLLAAALLAAFGGCRTSPSPAPASGAAAAAAAATAPRTVPQYSIEQFLGTTSYTGASFSPDRSKILVSSNATGVFNVYAIPTSGGAPAPLTNSTTQSQFAVSYFPHDERFLYRADQGGNELDHIYVRERDGRTVDLTPGEKLKAQFAGWAADDRGFYVLTNERDSRFFDLYEYSTDGYLRTRLFTDTVGYNFGAISPDKRRVAMTKTHRRSDTDIYLFDRTSGATTRMTPHQGEVSYQALDFTPDGRALLMTSDEGGEFAVLYRHDLATGRRDEVVRAPWDVVGAEYARDGRHLIVMINDDARSELRVYDAATMKRVPLPALPNADITSAELSRDGTTLAYYVNGSRAPSDLYVLTLGSGEPPRQLTRSLNPAIDPANLVEARMARFKSYDGVEVPGVLYTPLQASADRKAPALVWVHGGPGGQSRYGYSGFIQYLVNHGYVVYAINNRGSSGYGKTFFAMDDRKHGEADLKDVVESKKMLVATGVVDPKKIGVIGGSYGGYMVLAALTYAPEEFDAGVDLYGVANWLRTLSSIPPWWASIRERLYAEMGDPVADSAYLRRISPLFHASNIRRPLMVLQGANDPRVLKVESDEIVAAARKNGVPVEYVVFPDEGHGFVKKENQLRAYRGVLEFLDVHLKKAVPTTATP